MVDADGIVLFDAGPAGSQVHERALLLHPRLDYSAERGFGWVKKPDRSFVRPELSRSRSEDTIDGVEGSVYTFKADVPEGRWGVAIWFEAPLAKQFWPAVFLNGAEQQPGWQEFRANAEPEKEQYKLIRILRAAVDVGPQGLLLEFEGPKGVRLLGLSLIREGEPNGDRERELRKRLARAGRYASQDELEPLERELVALGQENLGGLWLAARELELSMLKQAERYAAMRGWHWADQETGLGLFDRQYQAVMLLDGVLAPGVTESLFAERAGFLRGKLLYWLNQERRGAAENAGAERDLNLLAARYPGDRLLAMYQGQRIASSSPCDSEVAGVTYEAPAWSVKQREALCRMRAIAHWWVDNRQAENGEFGGKLGDDVELLRWWAPLCLVGDKKSLGGWKTLADGVWNSAHVSGGYARKVADVEHAAEFIADTAPLMVVYSDDPVYQDRLAASADLFESLWTGWTRQKRRHFRSAWFSSSALDTEGTRGRDHEFNTRAVQAVRYLAWRRPDPSVTRLLHEWSEAWVDCALRTDKGKPVGVIPASVRFEDGSINGDGGNWFQANMYWDYYEWESFTGSLMLDQLLFTHLLTGDDRLLEPMRLHLKLIREHAASVDVAPEGTSAWAAGKLLDNDLFWKVVEQWRHSSGDSRWDDLIVGHGSPYGRYRVSGDTEHLLAGLDSLLEDLRHNTPMKTSEAIYTDRVYVRDWELLKGMLTGDGVTNSLSPHLWVSWENTDDDFTALVSDTGPDGLTVEVFSHAAVQTEVTMRLWRAPSERCSMTLSVEGALLEDRVIDSTSLGRRLTVELPPRRPMTIRFVPAR